MSQPPATSEPVRIDKWLWAARFFKTRVLAAEAVNGGKVHIDGARVKPGKKVAPGMRLDITLGWTTRSVDVLATAQRRGSATVAQTLYKETDESLRRREIAEQQHKLQVTAPHSERRPDKRDRRRLMKFKQR